MFECGMVWCGVVWCGVVWRGVVCLLLLLWIMFVSACIRDFSVFSNFYQKLYQNCLDLNGVVWDVEESGQVPTNIILDDDDDHFGGDGFDGPMDQDTDATKREDEEGGNAAAVDFGNGLVAEPAKVAKISINYAKVAKKVDVKALKSTIWTDLCDSPAPSTAKDKDKGNAKKDTFEGERTFESLLASVEKRAGNEVGEVSVALCFICMLHLCNEKGLALAQEGIEDLHISASKT